MIRRRTLATLTASTLVLSACGSGGQEGTQAGGSEKVDVVVGFYPLEYAVQRIGGDRVEVTNLTKPGAEPHDVELTPKDIATVGEADLAVYEKSIQPAVDEAIAGQQVDQTLDVAQAAQLDAVVDQPIIDVSDPDAGHDHGHDDHGHDHGTETSPADEHGHEGHDHGTETPAAGATTPAEEHAEEEHGHEGHDHGLEAGAIDPHFWLDPVRYEKVAQAITQKLSAVDPEGKSTYEQNMAALQKDLEALDAEYENGLKSCSSTTLVTSHAAFGYLAARYGFEQAAISGLSPEQEPEPQRLAQVADYAKKNDVKAIYAETLTSPAVAETVARETGAEVKVLDPIEGLTQEGSDYLGIMRSNLETLKDGQGCS